MKHVSKALVYSLAVALAVCGYTREAGSQARATSPTANAKEAPAMTNQHPDLLRRRRAHREPERQQRGTGFCRHAAPHAHPARLRWDGEDQRPPSYSFRARARRWSFNRRLGDIAFYAPWGNFAVFYRGFRYSPGLVLLGHIDTGVETLGRTGSMTARIERLPDRRAVVRARGVRCRANSPIVERGSMMHHWDGSCCCWHIVDARAWEGV